MVSPVLTRAHPDNVSMDRTRNTVMHHAPSRTAWGECNWQFDHESCYFNSYFHIAERYSRDKRHKKKIESYHTVMHTSLQHIPNCSLLNNVPHQEMLDSLVLFDQKPKLTSRSKNDALKFKILKRMHSNAKQLSPIKELSYNQRF